MQSELTIDEAVETPDVELAGPSEVAPVRPDERISSVDLLRGIALSGILLMNILDFGMAHRGPEGDLAPGAGASVADLTYWSVSHVLFEGKMRGLFSLLFGAGVILFTERAESRGGEARVADLYYRRVLWLVAFGLVHAYFIWNGDILFHYGVIGLFLFPFRKARPAVLIALGVFLLSCAMLKSYWGTAQMVERRDKAEAAEKVLKAGGALTEKQREERDEWVKELKDMRPSAEKVAEQVADHRGSYARLFARRAKEVEGSQGAEVYRWGFFDAGGMMLVGMGLMKLGVLSGSKSLSWYLALAAFGYGLGVPLNSATGYRIWSSGFDPFVLERMQLWYSPGRLLIDLGHIGFVLSLVKLGVLTGLFGRVAAAGRMALTNYLATSVVCTLIFNGYGLGFFDKLHRAQLLYVVALVWISYLLISPVWLRHFRYGPMEWAWRSLTYARLQPMRQPPAGPSGA